MSEKASKGRFLKPEKLQNHSNEGKGKRKKKEPGEGKNEKGKKTGKREEGKSYILSFYNSYFGDTFRPRKNVGRKKVHLAITF